MGVSIAESWKRQMKDEFKKDYFIDLTKFVKEEYEHFTVYPPGKDIFRAFDKCDWDNSKVIVIGQDPYHGPNQANGLCFSVKQGVGLPPSLINIFKEIKDDTGKPVPQYGDLERWAEQGVLLLNATLTVRANSPGSHQNKGWETFTDAVIRKLSGEKTNLVFLLWGSFAQKKKELIDLEKHFILESPHPSPLSANRGFLGNRHFSKTNAYLRHVGKEEIDW